MRLPQTTRKKARIEIIPMIDAIFFLLVFFMFSSLSMVKMNGLPVALPKAPPTTSAGDKTTPSATRNASAVKPATPKRFVLAIQPGNETLVDGASVRSDDALVQSLTARLKAEPDAVVVVRAASGVSAQRLIGVMDALNRVTLPGGKRPQLVVATIAAPPSNRTNVLPVPRAKGVAVPNAR